MGAYGSPEFQPKSRIENCPKCGFPNTDDGNYCSYCGFAFYSQNSNNVPPSYHNTPFHSDVESANNEHQKGTWSNVKIIISIISMVLFLIILVQSCASLYYSIIQSDDSTSSSHGFVSALFLLIAGIISIVTRNTKGKSGSIVATLFYFLSALLTIGAGEMYPDLPIWGSVAFAFGLINLGSAFISIKTSKPKKTMTIIAIIIISLSIFVLACNESNEFSNNLEIENSVTTGETLNDVADTKQEREPSTTEAKSENNTSNKSKSTNENKSVNSSANAVDNNNNQAVRKAKSYLDFSAFSRKGLIEQLEFDGFTTAQATYGVDHSGANWNEQAVKKAKSYLSFSAFSRKGLIEQLEFEDFTTDQATYGVNRCGANWKEQAAKKAKTYLNIMPFSRNELIEQLIFEGFTSEEANYGVTASGL